MTDAWIIDHFNRRLNDLRDVSRAELRRLDEWQQQQHATTDAKLRDIERRLTALERSAACARGSEGA